MHCCLYYKDFFKLVLQIKRKKKCKSPNFHCRFINVLISTFFMLNVLATSLLLEIINYWIFFISSVSLSFIDLFCWLAVSRYFPPRLSFCLFLYWSHIHCVCDQYVVTQGDVWLQRVNLITGLLLGTKRETISEVLTFSSLLIYGRKKT